MESVAARFRRQGPHVFGCDAFQGRLSNLGSGMAIVSEESGTEAGKIGIDCRNIVERISCRAGHRFDKVTAVTEGRRKLWNDGTSRITTDRKQDGNQVDWTMMPADGVGSLGQPDDGYLKLW